MINIEEKLTEVHRLEDELLLYWRAEEPDCVLHGEDGDTEDVWGEYLNPTFSVSPSPVISMTNNKPVLTSSPSWPTLASSTVEATKVRVEMKTTKSEAMA